MELAAYVDIASCYEASIPDDHNIHGHYGYLSVASGISNR